MGLSVLVQSRDTLAYDESTHSRFVELAVRAMKLSEKAELRDGASAEFNAYLNAVKAAPENLGRLRVGFPSKIAAGTIDPVYGFNAPDEFPFSTLDFAGRCADKLRHDEARDLRLVGKSELSEFNMNVVLPEDSEGCGLRAFLTAELEEQSANERGMERALGWHAGIPDQRPDDSAAWIRPTTVGMAGLALEVTSQYWNYGMGTLAIPFIALYKLFSGEDFELDDSYELAREYNPIDTVQGAVPGVGDFRSTLFTGLWHFETLDADINGYNDIRGLWYPGGGAGGAPYPSSVDIAISSLTIATGASLNALAAQGDDRYGQFDQVKRNWAQWQAHPIGLTEFSPLHNLARYGWEQYLGSGATDAEGLGWPLHAIGDACAPQHLISTTGWGHRPFENWAAQTGEDVLFPPDEREPQLMRVVEESFEWFSLLEDNGGKVDEFIIQLAHESRDIIAAQGDWQYSDDAFSAAAFVGEAGWTHREYGRDVIGTEHEEHVRELAEQAMSAALGFLVFAANQIPATSAAEEIPCPAGEFFGPKAEVRPGNCDRRNSQPCPDITVTVGACVAPPGDVKATEPLLDSVSMTSLDGGISPDGGASCVGPGGECGGGDCCPGYFCGNGQCKFKVR